MKAEQEVSEDVREMKKILITGARSYVGESFEKWMKQYGDEYVIDTVDMIGDEWKRTSFVGYDVVFHVAGIAHVDARKNMKELYYRVNRDLAVETARKAKSEGVRQFIFMSSIIVYGDSGRIGEKRVITRETVPKPTNYYGSSKLQAEKGILKLQGDGFNVVVLRPPMIYGKGSKGNYQKLVKLVRWCPVFPDIDNERSMLYVDNLCEFVRFMVDNEERGVFFPQNREYVGTTEMVREIAKAYGKRIKVVKFLNFFIRLVSMRFLLIDKVFGNLVYDKELSDYKDYQYCVMDFNRSIRLTESC